MTGQQSVTETEIPTACNRLSAAVTKLKELNTILEERLKSILQPSVPTPTIDKDSQLRLNRAPLAEFIHAQAEQLEKIIDEFEDRNHRCAL